MGKVYVCSPGVCCCALTGERGAWASFALQESRAPLRLNLLFSPSRNASRGGGCGHTRSVIPWHCSGPTGDLMEVCMYDVCMYE